MGNDINAIKIKNLSKNYGDFKLDNVSFVVPNGSVMGFIGQNGAGKTTTIKEILNLIHRDSGEIRVLGFDNIKDEKKIKEDVGVVFDDLCFHDNLNIIQINKIMKHIYKNWSQDEFFNKTDKFELPRKKAFKKFSRGMRMKTSIAVALSHKARLLILDEPTSGLDPIMRNEILNILQDFVMDESHSIIFSSHITADLERIADYLTFIHNGKIIFSEEKISLIERHGILKCKAADYDALDKSGIISVRKSTFGIEALVNDNKLYKKLYPNYVMDTPSIDDIMLFYSTEGAK